MYYRKYFSGTVDATTTTNQYYMGLDKVATGTSRTSGHIKNRSDVIGNALVSTFKDIGYPNAYWDSTSGYFFIDKTNSRCGVYVTVQSARMYFNWGYVNSSYNYINTTTASTTATVYGNSLTPVPFQATGVTATNYAFYITVKGEPTGMLSVFIGAYDNHSQENYIFTLGIGKDKRDESKATVMTCLGETTYNFFVNNYNTAKEIVSTQLLTTNTLSMLDELIVLIPLIMKYGFIFMDNTYFNPGLSAGFYEIDGDTYYVTSYYITKCITTV